MNTHNTLTISVIICTRNRSLLLRNCFLTLERQRKRPFEIIVVDNGSKDATRQVCKEFKKTLPIKYFFDPRIGIPFGRNTGIQQAKGDVYAFIDDDCEAYDDWTTEIYTHFTKHPISDIAVGFNYPRNFSIPSDVEQVFYERWLSQNIPQIHTETLARSGNFIDFKNCAVRSSVMKHVLFSHDAPFGDVGDEDVEVGNRLYRTSRAVWFVPKMKIRHHNSSTVYRALYRNFWKGYANQLLLLLSIDITVVPIRIKKFDWVLHTIKEQYAKNGLGYMLQFVALFVVYPLASRLGRMVASFTSRCSIQQKIPKRV